MVHGFSQSSMSSTYNQTCCFFSPSVLIWSPRGEASAGKKNNKNKKTSVVCGWEKSNISGLWKSAPWLYEKVAGTTDWFSQRLIWEATTAKRRVSHDCAEQKLNSHRCHCVNLHLGASSCSGVINNGTASCDYPSISPPRHLCFSAPVRAWNTRH